MKISGALKIVFYPMLALLVLIEAEFSSITFATSRKGALIGTSRLYKMAKWKEVKN